MKHDAKERRFPEWAKAIIIVLALFLFFPLGLLLLWFWVKWPVWVKILVGVVPFLIVSSVAITAAVLLAAINPAGQLAKARDAKRMFEASQVNQAVELYYVDKNVYPSSLSDLVPRYVPSVPEDPTLHLPYSYGLTPSGKSYYLCVTLEVPKTTKCWPEDKNLAP